MSREGLGIHGRPLLGQFATDVPDRAPSVGVARHGDARAGAVDAVPEHHGQVSAHHGLTQRSALHRLRRTQAGERQQGLVAGAGAQEHPSRLHASRSPGAFDLHDRRRRLGLDGAHLPQRHGAWCGRRQSSQQVRRIDHGLGKAQHVPSHAGEPRRALGGLHDRRTRPERQPGPQHACSARQARRAPQVLVRRQHAQATKIGTRTALQEVDPEGRRLGGLRGVVACHAAKRVLHARVKDSLAAGGLAEAKRARLDQQRGASSLAQRMQREEAGDAASDHECIDLDRVGHGADPSLGGRDGG